METKQPAVRPGERLQELTCQGKGEEEIPSEVVCTHRQKHMYAKYSLEMRFESGQGCDPAALCNSSSPAVGCCQSVGHPCATALAISNNLQRSLACPVSPAEAATLHSSPVPCWAARHHVTGQHD